MREGANVVVEANPPNVLTAYELLMEELDAINRSGAAAFAAGDHP
jgi:hypothetical protein